jgi:hypothetical protein
MDADAVSLCESAVDKASTCAEDAVVPPRKWTMTHAYMQGLLCVFILG